MGAGSSQNGATLLEHQKEATNRSTVARKRQPIGGQLPVSWEWELPSGSGSSQMGVGAPKRPKERLGAPRSKLGAN